MARVVIVFDSVPRSARRCRRRSAVVAPLSSAFCLVISCAVVHVVDDDHVLISVERLAHCSSFGERLRVVLWLVIGRRCRSSQKGPRSETLFDNRIFVQIRLRVSFDFTQLIPVDSLVQEDDQVRPSQDIWFFRNDAEVLAIGRYPSLRVLDISVHWPNPPWRMRNADLDVITFVACILLHAHVVAFCPVLPGTALL